MTKRKDGRYCQNVTVGTGKRKMVYANSPKELKQKIKKLMSELDMGIDYSADDSFVFWAERFLKRFKANHTASWYDTEKSRLSLFVDELGQYSVKDIKAIQIEDILQDIAVKNPYTNRPSSDKTIKEYAAICSSVFEFCIENKVCNFNPCKFVDVKGKKDKKERRALSQEEIDAIVNSDCRARLSGIICIYTGLRLGELTALTWDDIDMVNKCIRVNKSYDYKSASIKKPKTVSGIRLVPMNRIVYDELSKIPVRFRTGYVINEDGRMMTQGLWRSYSIELITTVDKAINIDKEPVYVDIQGYRKILIRIEPFDYHCLRHTYATLLYAHNVDVKTSQLWLGHKDLSTTMKIYTHLSQQKQNEAIEQWYE